MKYTPPTTDMSSNFFRGFETGQRQQQLGMQQQEIEQNQQKLAQQQAVMKLGQIAAQTADPRALAMYSAVNPEGGKALRENVDYFVKKGTAELKSIKDAKITDRPAIYKMKIADLQKNNPYLDFSNYPAEYDPAIVNPLLDADIAAGRDMSKAYQAQETDQGLMSFDTATGQLAPTGAGVYRKPPSTVVNVNNTQEGAFEKSVGDKEGEGVVKYLDEVRAAGDQAIATKDFLQVQRDAIGQLKSTGPLTGVQSFLGNLASQISDEGQRGTFKKLIEDAKNIDEIEAAGRKIAIPLAKQLGYNPTDADFKAIIATIADVAKGKKTNEDLINMWDRLADKAIAKANKADEIAGSNRYKTARRELRDFELDYKYPEQRKESTSPIPGAPSSPTTAPNPANSPTMGGEVEGIKWRVK